MSPREARALPAWTPILVFWVALGVVAALQEAWLFHSLGRPLSPLTALAWEAPKFILWGLFTPLVVELDRRVGAHAPAPRFFGAHVALAAVLILIHLTYATLADYVVLPPPEGPAAFAGMLARQFSTRLQFDALSYAGILGGWYGLDYFRRHREEERTSAHLERALARSELQALKMQVQPHFLFNALQALAVLNRRDPAAVTTNLVRLGALYRHLIDSRGVQEVTLARELDFVRQYLALEEVRFPDRLRVVLDVPEEILGATVPHLILQPLVENAIRHGIAPLEQGGTVTIRGRGEDGMLVLDVIDDGVGLGVAAMAGHGTEARVSSSEGVGLEITRSRLLHLHGEAASLTVVPREGGGTLARVRLPLRIAEEDVVTSPRTSPMRVEAST